MWLIKEHAQHICVMAAPEYNSLFDDLPSFDESEILEAVLEESILEEPVPEEPVSEEAETRELGPPSNTRGAAPAYREYRSFIEHFNNLPPNYIGIDITKRKPQLRQLVEYVLSPKNTHAVKNLIDELNDSPDNELIEKSAIQLTVLMYSLVRQCVTSHPRYAPEDIHLMDIVVDVEFVDPRKDHRLSKSLGLCFSRTKCPKGSKCKKMLTAECSKYHQPVIDEYANYVLSVLLDIEMFRVLYQRIGQNIYDDVFASKISEGCLAYSFKRRDRS